MTTETQSISQHDNNLRHASVQEAEEWLCSITPEMTSLIESAWQKAKIAEGNFARDFYDRLFETAPQTAALFTGDMDEQGQRLVYTLEQTLKLIADPPNLLLLLKATGVRHIHYQVKPEYFDVMQQVLIEVLADRGGDSFTREHREVWTHFFNKMAIIMCHQMKSQ